MYKAMVFTYDEFEINIYRLRGLVMNKVRRRILEDIKYYESISEHKDLIAFTVGADYFTFDYETGKEFEADFYEIVAIVDKEWLFDFMMADDIENPLEYLQNEYTWDDSIEWFNNAKIKGKVVAVRFN